MRLFGAAFALFRLYGFFDETMKANGLLFLIILFALNILLLLSCLLRLSCFLCNWGRLLVLVLVCHFGNLGKQLDILEVDGGLILLDKDGLPLGLEDIHQFLDLIDRTLLRLILVDIRQRL